MQHMDVSQEPCASQEHLQMVWKVVEWEVGGRHQEARGHEAV